MSTHRDTGGKSAIPACRAVVDSTGAWKADKWPFFETDGTKSVIIGIEGRHAAHLFQCASIPDNCSSHTRLLKEFLAKWPTTLPLKKKVEQLLRCCFVQMYWSLDFSKTLKSTSACLIKSTESQ
mmetsp:Transcript_102396/g.186983  ORF Transcript_102396/g.186983 Transcript_102396/m.186983 type:complete len:124 (+) Transcript_102396:806-1177(+)